MRALYRLAKKYNLGPIPVAEIAAREQMPRKFLESILLQLRNSGIVESRQGKAGGYYLPVPPNRITLGSVIRAIDGPLSPLPCAGKEPDRSCPECGIERPCETSLIMREVGEAISSILDRTTLAQICERQEGAHAGYRSPYDA